MKTWLARLFVSTLASTMTFAQDPKGLRRVVASKDAPQAIGPYSQAVKAGGFVFASEQIAIDPATGKLIEGDIAA
jgi:enamine deaminase RidA (YjgF/YER057c/UK114 family)